MITRRRLLTTCTASFLALTAHGQTPGRLYRVAYLGYTVGTSPGSDQVEIAFVERLRELGFVEGKNLILEWRYAEGRNERYADFAAELVRLKTDVVVASSGVAARAVMGASSTLPIVTIALPDAVRTGLVKSLARPGGQLTGITNLADELVPKRIEILRSVLPSAIRVAFVRCPRCLRAAGATEAEFLTLQRDEGEAARSLGVTWLPLDVNGAEDFAAAASSLRHSRPDALLIGATPVNAALQRDWLALGAELRLPVLAPYRGFGAMLSYGPEYVAVFRKAAEYVAKILNGVRPGDLPMEQPTKFEFVINLRLARDLGVTIPKSALVRADEVIE